MIKENEYRKKTEKKWHIRTMRGLLRNVFESMQTQSLEPRFDDAPLDDLCCRYCFYKESLGDKNFSKLFTAWVDSSFEHKLRPTACRIDNTKGYTLGNIIFRTRKEKEERGESRPRGDCGRGRKATQLKRGIKVLRFDSATAASKHLGLSVNSVAQAIRQKRKVAGWAVSYL